MSLRKLNQGSETTSPWCRLISEFPQVNFLASGYSLPWLEFLFCNSRFTIGFTYVLQNQTIHVSATNFLIGSSKNAHLPIKQQTVSATLCSIRLTQVLLQFLVFTPIIFSNFIAVCPWFSD